MGPHSGQNGQNTQNTQMPSRGPTFPQGSTAALAENKHMHSYHSQTLAAKNSALAGAGTTGSTLSNGKTLSNGAMNANSASGLAAALANGLPAGYQSRFGTTEHVRRGALSEVSNANAVSNTGASIASSSIGSKNDNNNSGGSGLGQSSSFLMQNRGVNNPAALSASRRRGAYAIGSSANTGSVGGGNQTQGQNVSTTNASTILNTVSASGSSLIDRKRKPDTGIPTGRKLKRSTAVSMGINANVSAAEAFKNTMQPRRSAYSSLTSTANIASSSTTTTNSTTTATASAASVTSTQLRSSETSANRNGLPLGVGRQNISMNKMNSQENVESMMAIDDMAMVNDENAVGNDNMLRSETMMEEEIQQEEQQLSQEQPEQDWDDLDADDEYDPMMVSEYVNEIFDYMKELEVQTLPNPNYMDDQKELLWHMRTILVDWLIEVHNKFKLLPETLYMSVNIIDRFLSLRIVSVPKLQLVGITAMFVASKYEEVVAPSIQNFIYMADGGYTEEEILKAERYMLQVLDFSLQYPSPMSFLRRCSKADNYDIQTRTLAKYFMEISLLDHNFLEITPSMVAAASMYLARVVLDRGGWDKNLVHYSGYTEAELIHPVQLLLKYIRAPHTQEALYKKYASRKYMRISVFVANWVSHGSTVPGIDSQSGDNAQMQLSQRNMNIMNNQQQTSSGLKN